MFCLYQLLSEKDRRLEETAFTKKALEWLDEVQNQLPATDSNITSLKEIKSTAYILSRLFSDARKLDLYSI
jgi:hypothetical protein